MKSEALPEESGCIRRREIQEVEFIYGFHYIILYFPEGYASQLSVPDYIFGMIIKSVPGLADTSGVDDIFPPSFKIQS